MRRHAERESARGPVLVTAAVLLVSAALALGLAAAGFGQDPETFETCRGNGVVEVVEARAQSWPPGTRCTYPSGPVFVPLTVYGWVACAVAGLVLTVIIAGVGAVIVVTAKALHGRLRR